MTPKYRKLAKSVAHMDHLVIAKIDGTKNDIEGVRIEGFPSIFYYGPGEDPEKVHYQGRLSKKGLTKFLKKQMGDAWTEEGTTDL